MNRREVLKKTTKGGGSVSLLAQVPSYEIFGIPVLLDNKQSAGTIDFIMFKGNENLVWNHKKSYGRITNG